MTTQQYEEQLEDLFERWNKARPEYEIGGRFSEDGITDYDEWLKAKPRIMFLLKEDRSEENDWEPDWGLEVQNKSFSKNLARWRQIIIEMYNNPEAMPDFDSIQLPKSFDDIAIVEIKKKNEGKGVSSMPEIKQYAERDKEFIREEIDLIDPQVIICGNTAEFYGDIVYDDESWDNDECTIINRCTLQKHRNRVVIDMFHPSTRSKERERLLFDSLVQLITKSGVFKKEGNM